MLMRGLKERTGMCMSKDKEKDFSTIGIRIKNFRIERGLSQEQLGELSHFSTATIRAIERGINSPSVDTLVMIADALKISADDILEDVLDYPHSSPFEEANNILMDCNPDEERMLISVLRFMKDLFSEFGI